MTGKRHYFKIAEYDICVILPECYDIKRLLPSFVSFLIPPQSYPGPDSIVSTICDQTQTNKTISEEDSIQGKELSHKGRSPEPNENKDREDNLRVPLLELDFADSFIYVPKDSKNRKDFKNTEESNGGEDDKIGEIEKDPTVRFSKCREIERTKSDIGFITLSQLDEMFVVEIDNVHDELHHKHYLTLSPLGIEPKITIDYSAPYLSHAISSIIRIAFAQFILRYGGISIHSSAVLYRDETYLFLGKSGTGKSTHSSLWIKNFKGCRLLNDDNPILRIIGNEIRAYGSPWSGKTHCYRNENAKVKGIVQLKQSLTNKFINTKDVASFNSILPSCSVLRYSEELNNCLYDTLTTIIGKVKVGILECLPNDEAARLCYESVNTDK